MAFENLKKAGIKYLLGKIKTHLENTYLQIANAVRTINGIGPNQYGDVPITRVDYAGDLESSQTQTSDETFIVRTAGGAASINDGDAWLAAVLGNMVHTGHVNESLDMQVIPLGDDDHITGEINRATFFANETLPASPITLTFTTAWSTNPATYGITLTGTPVAGDQIMIAYVREVPGTITPATPDAFKSTGWNLYNPATGYARLPRYSDEYGYGISGAYTAVKFASTAGGAQTDLPVDNGHFNVPQDGYVFVTGASSESTMIWATWSDFTPSAFEAYTETEIDLSEIMSEYFPDGLCKVENVYDEINLSLGRAIVRIETMENDAENMAAAIASGRAFTYDETTIYIVKATESTNSIELSGAYTADDHGVEFFTSTDAPTETRTSYGTNLKNKLERDVPTLSQQTLTEAQKAQVRQNIGAGSSQRLEEVAHTFDTLFKYTYYEKTVASLADGTGMRLSAAEMGYSTPTGYKPLALVRYTSGQYKVATSYVNIVATGDQNAIGIFNSSGATQTSFKVGIGVLYVKSGLGM